MKTLSTILTFIVFLLTMYLTWQVMGFFTPERVPEKVDYAPRYVIPYEDNGGKG